MSVTFSRLADRPELIDQLVAAYESCWPGWYGPGGRGDARADLGARAGAGRLPLGLVACEAGLAVGACALAGESMSRSGAFGAWLVGLWTAPAHRRRGIAAGLLAAAVREARALRIGELRAGTSEAARLFERAGWTRLPPALHEGVQIQAFSIRP